jgi:hypothetical protein
MVSKRINLALPLLLVVALLFAPASNHVAVAQSEVAERFLAYYNQIEGIRVFGAPLTAEVEVNGIPAQYFEKARLEDHRASVPSGTWAFMYGRLTDELMARDPTPMRL